MIRSTLWSALVAIFVGSPAFAASGEMGTGVPNFGSYSLATGTHLSVWSLANATRPMAAGCAALTLSPETMGLDAYKIAVAMLVAAKISERSVRFYAHGEHEGGCGVDYVEIV
jgi:hypothetical protein